MYFFKNAENEATNLCWSTSFKVIDDICNTIINKLKTFKRERENQNNFFNFTWMKRVIEVR